MKTLRKKRTISSEYKKELCWILFFPILLPPAILYALILGNEAKLKQQCSGNYESEEIMRGNAMGSACLMIFFIIIWCFGLPLGSLTWTVHKCFGFASDTSFLMSIIPSIVIGLLFLSLCMWILFPDNKKRKKSRKSIK